MKQWPEIFFLSSRYWREQKRGRPWRSFGHELQHSSLRIAVWTSTMTGLQRNGNNPPWMILVCPLINLCSSVLDRLSEAFVNLADHFGTSLDFANRYHPSSILGYNGLPTDLVTIMPIHNFIWLKIKLDIQHIWCLEQVQRVFFTVNGGLQSLSIILTWR